MTQLIQLGVFRHANATPAADASMAADLQRLTTEVGENQTSERNWRLKEYGFSWNVAFSGPANRTRHIAYTLSGCLRIDILDGLGYPDPSTEIGARCELMYRAYGHAPYEVYLKDPDCHLIHKWGMAAWNVLKADILKLSSQLSWPEGKWLGVMVGAHGVYMNALGIAATGRDERNFFNHPLCETGFREAEGFVLTLEDWEPVRVDLHTD